MSVVVAWGTRGEGWDFLALASLNYINHPLNRNSYLLSELTVRERYAGLIWAQKR